MTRKDYVKFAQTIAIAHKLAKSCPYLTGKEMVEKIGDSISIILAGDNPRFDRKRFVEACHE
jgi:hypothetical protein